MKPGKMILTIIFIITIVFNNLIIAQEGAVTKDLVNRFEIEVNMALRNLN